MLSFKMSITATKRLVASAAFATILVGCTSIQPLYRTVSADSNVAAELRAIKIEPIPERLGHYLGNELIFALNGSGSSGPYKYRLVLNVRERVQTPLIDTVNGRATAATVMSDVDYKLYPINGGDSIVSGTVFAIATYDRTSQRFANLRAARNAEIRDAKSNAEQIRAQIADKFVK